MLSHKLNLTYKDGKELSDDSNIQFLDKLSGNYMLTCRMGGFSSSVLVNCVGERKGNLKGKTDEVKVPGYALLNLKATYELNKNISFSLSVLNLLGNDYAYPEFIRRNIKSIPGDKGRNVYG